MMKNEIIFEEYYPFSIPVRAVQLTKENIPAVARYLNGKVKALNSGAKLYLSLPHALHTFFPEGNYIVILADGKVTGYSRFKFEKNYYKKEEK